MSKMQKKVPSLEFRYSISKSDSNSVHFSMMSDFNIEETLFRVKDLKQKSNADDDEWSRFIYLAKQNGRERE